jgi:hypothetical protein
MARMSVAGSTEIEAPIARVWAVVEDVLIAPTWQGGLVAATVLEHDAERRPALVELESDLKVRRMKTLVRYSYEPPVRLLWTQVKGDLRSIEGSWFLEDLGGGRTIATYTLEGDPGGMLGMLVRGPVEAATRAALSARPGELKAHVEGN